MNKSPVVAIDGPVGSGKGTIARQVARALGWHLVGLAAVKQRMTEAGEDELAALAAELSVRFESGPNGQERIFLDDEDVTTDVRTEECGRMASFVASMQGVRAALLDLQQGFRKEPGLVADGRDMGSTVFPEAVLKVYLTASAEERAKRRHKQLKDKGIDVSLPALSRDIEDRDRRDSERTVAPLRPAEDARLLDSSGHSIEEVTQIVLGWVAEVEEGTKKY
jgi:cytidylate kinase